MIDNADMKPSGHSWADSGKGFSTQMSRNM